jgi:hypothetical protein
LTHRWNKFTAFGTIRGGDPNDPATGRPLGHSYKSDDLYRVLSAVDRAGKKLDNLVVVGHGNEIGIEDDTAKGGPPAISVDKGKICIWHNGHSEDVTGMLRRITDSKTTIELRGCDTSGLANHLAQALGNGAQVSGYAGDVLIPPGQSGAIVPASGRQTYRKRK